MAFLDRFRKKDEETLELADADYQPEEPAPSRPAAVLFGFFALIITLAIAGGLFFGARAVYRSLTDTKSGEIAEQEKEAEQAQKADQAKESGVKVETNNPQGSNTSPQNPGSNQTNPTPAPSPAPSSMPSTGDTLPATGDEGL